MPEWSPLDLLPGLWVAALALLGARALRRWYDPLPGPVLAAFLVAAGVLFWRPLVGGEVLLPLDNLRGRAPFTALPPTEPHGNVIQGDLIQLVAPSRLEVQRALETGRWPLLNPLAGLGVPLLADPQAQALQPLALLAWPFGVERAAGVIAALEVLTALAFTFLALGRHGLCGGPALAGAFAVGLGGFTLLWLGWPIATTAALLPLVLYALARADQEGGRRDFALLALATAALLLGGHPETILYALLFAGAVLLARTLGREPGGRLRWFGANAAALAIGAALAAPALLPAALHLPHTLRADRLAGPSPPWPPSPGSLPPSPGEGGNAPGGEVTAEGSAAKRWVPIVAPNAYGNSRYVHYWGLANTNEDASGFAGTATLLAALLAFLPQGRRRLPLERLVLGALLVALVVVARPPGLGPLLDLLPELGTPGHRRLLLLVNLGLAWLAAATLQRCRDGEARRWPAVPCAAALGVLIAWAYLAHPHPADPALLAPLRDGWLHWQMRFLVLATLLLLLGRGRRWMPHAYAGLVAAELLLCHLPANPPMPRRLAFPVVEPIRFVQERIGTDRMAALGPAFPPNLPGIYGLADARVYNPAAPVRWARLMEPVVAGWDGEVPRLGRPGHPLYRRLGVRFLLTGPSERLRRPWRKVWDGPAARVWERPDPLPRAYLEGPGGPAPLADLAIEWHRVGGRVAGPTGLGVVLRTSVLQEGGWRLVVDGRRRATAIEAGALVAARLPAGAERIELVYRPRGFVAGCALAALALAVGAAWWLPPPSSVSEIPGAPSSVLPLSQPPLPGGGDLRSVLQVSRPSPRGGGGLETGEVRRGAAPNPTAGKVRGTYNPSSFADPWSAAMTFAACSSSGSPSSSVPA